MFYFGFTSFSGKKGQNRISYLREYRDEILHHALVCRRRKKSEVRIISTEFQAVLCPLKIPLPSTLTTSSFDSPTMSRAIVSSTENGEKGTWTSLARRSKKQASTLLLVPSRDR